MPRVTVINLFFAVAQSAELATNHTDIGTFNRALRVSPSQVDLDATTLGKHGLSALQRPRPSSLAPRARAKPRTMMEIRTSYPFGRPTRIAIAPRNMGVCNGLKTGIVGLPNVGKSTLFNAVMKQSQAEAANYPFCTIEPNTGLVALPDERLEELSKLSKSKSTVATQVSFVDIAGIVKGASEGAGLGNKFLSHIRETDAVVHVVRCFEDEDITHVDGSVDPVRDAEVITLELILADIAQIERRYERMGKDKKLKPADVAEEKKALDAIMEKLNAGIPARVAELTEEGAAFVRGHSLLTMKPVIYAANVAEGELADGAASNPFVAALKKKAAEEGAPLITVSAKMESDLVDFEEEEREEYMAELGVKESGLEKLIKEAYSTLGLSTYYTSGEKESRAWTIKKGMTAPQAAGVIHTDFEKGFIRAETIAYKDFVECGSEKVCREKGVLRSEGKEYVVQDGDVILFRFNV